MIKSKLKTLKKNYILTKYYFRKSPLFADDLHLKNIRYQKLAGKTASVNDNNFSSMKTFPNPIKPGHLLTIESQTSLLNHKIDLYNINAQKIATLIFNEKNNNQYEVSIPEKLASGLYFYKVFDKDGGFVNNGKIQIQ